MFDFQSDMQNQCLLGIQLPIVFSHNLQYINSTTHNWITQYPNNIYSLSCYSIYNRKQVNRRQSQSYKFKEFGKISKFVFWNKHNTRHTFWICMIRFANIKWIWWVLLKILSRHDSVHRQTNRQMDKVKPVYPPFNFFEAAGTKMKHHYIESTIKFHQPITFV